MKIFKPLLIIDIIRGLVSLLVDLYIMLTKKADKRQKILDKIYFMP